MRFLLLPFVLLTFGCAALEGITTDPLIQEALVSEAVQIGTYEVLRKQKGINYEKARLIVDQLEIALMPADGESTLNWDAAQIVIQQQVEEVYRNIAFLVLGLTRSQVEGKLAENPDFATAIRLLKAAVAGAKVGIGRAEEDSKAVPV